MTRAAQGTAASDGNVVHEDAAGIPMPDPDGAGALAGRARELERIIAGLGASVAQSESRVGGLIAGLYERDAHPRSTLAKLDDTIPFLLFPVRIETVFAPGAPGAAPELWVRIYPDDIVVHTHESTLTDAEVEAGELYWTEFVVAEHLRADRDLRRRAAWRHLVQNLSGPRAAWVTRQTKAGRMGKHGCRRRGARSHRVPRSGRTGLIRSRCAPRRRARPSATRSTRLLRRAMATP